MPSIDWRETADVVAEDLVEGELQDGKTRLVPTRSPHAKNFGEGPGPAPFRTTSQVWKHHFCSPSITLESSFLHMSAFVRRIDAY